MLKKQMAACLVATALAASPAFAQTSAPPPSGATDRPLATGTGSPTMGSPAMQPGPSGTADTSSPAAAGSSASSSPGATSGGMNGQFMTEMQPHQIMASKLIGTTVVSANNEAIGDVNDVIVDRNGQAMAVVVGVGGFLGIGEKDVAVPFRLVEFASREQMNQASRNSSSDAGGVTATGSTAPTSGNTSAQRTASNRDGSLDRVMVHMTKAELQAAPTFRNRNVGEETRSSGTAPGSASKP